MWELLGESFNAVNTTIGLLISFVAAITMRRYSSIVFFSFIALFVDQFVAIAFGNRWGATVDEVTGQAIESLTSLDARILIVRFVGFMLVITVIYTIRSLFRR